MRRSATWWIVMGLVGLAGVRPAVADSPADVGEAAVEFVQRRERLAPDDLAGRMALGDWCERHDLLIQAAELYERVLELDVAHDDAYEQLVRIRDTTRLPEDKARQETLHEQFGEDLDLFVSPHFLIFYRADEQWMRNRAALLERAHDVFYSTFRRYNYRVMPLRERLVCVLFGDHAAYADHARTHDGIDVGWMTGYYSRRTNHIQFYDDRDAPHFKPVLERVEQLEQANKQLLDQMAEARRIRNHAITMELQRRQRPLLRELNWYRNRHEAIARIGDASKTVHEAVHQFAFNSGLQRRDRDYPFWLLEGLATNFETDDPAKPFGPLHQAQFRPRQVRQLLEQNALIDLDRFVMVRQAPASEQLAHVAYSQAFALFRFLFRYENDGLKKYLRTLNTAPPCPRSPDVLRQEFIEAFGPIRPLAQRFERYVQRLE